jgi:Xaa-Pro aminopeptidase
MLFDSYRRFSVLAPEAEWLDFTDDMYELRCIKYPFEENAYPRFRRGYYGHSLGIDTFHEEPPYVSEGNRTPIQEGMVLAVETPAYTTDAGAIVIEDLVHVLPNGIERLHALPHGLEAIP